MPEMRSLQIFKALLFSLVLLIGAGRSIAAVTASISGTVTDPSGEKNTVTPTVDERGAINTAGLQRSRACDRSTARPPAW